MWKKRFTNRVLQRGQMYYLCGNVTIDEVDDDYIGATVSSNDSKRSYSVDISFDDEPDSPQMWCDCPYAEEGNNCKHMAAVMYEIESKKLHELDGKPKAKEKKISLFEESDEENYQYFDIPALAEDVEFTEKVVDGARKDVRTQKVTFEKIETGYSASYMDYGDQHAMVYGTYHGDKGLIYDVQFEMDRENILSMSCMVPKCNCGYRMNSYYWRESEKKACRHVAALMLLANEYQKTHTVGDATDLQGMQMLEAFRGLHAQKMARKVESTDIIGQVDIQPRLILEDDELHLSFKIGKNKMYVMKSIKDFYTRNQNKDVLKLGKSETIDLAIAQYTPDARRYIEYINQEVKQEFQHKHRLEQKNRSWYAPEVKSESMSSYIDLYGTRIDEFFDMEIESGKPIAFIDRNIGAKERKISFKNGTIKAELEIYPEKKGKELESIRIEGSLPILISGSKYLYYIEENSICRLDDENRKLLDPLWNLSIDGDIEIHVGRNNIAEFYYRILPELEKCADITNHVGDMVEDFLPQDMDIIFYLDAEKNYLICRPMAKYENETFSIIDMREPTQIVEKYRDKLKEAEALSLATEYFDEFARDDNGDILICPDDEDRVYRLLDQGISEMMMIGEVRCTNSFKRKNTKKNLKISVGVSVQSDIMNLEISSDDISPKELLDILESYRLKKKYHRLKNGEFVDITDENIAELSAMMESMHISAKEFVTGKMNLPLYRALYLDKMLENCTEIYSSRDSYFRNLVKGFKTIADADYELPENLTKVLRNYQKYGYKWIRALTDNNFGGILADDMGLGKTLQMISVIAGTNIGTSLIVCPASLVYNWQEEFSQFAPNLKTAVVVGKADERKEIIDRYADYDAVITSYDLLKRDIAEYEDKHFEYQVIDEAQYIKTHTTAAAKSVKLIHAKHKMALTGTPIENRLSELWSIFDYLMPGFLYGYDVFKKEIETPIVKQKDEDATRRLKRMVSPFILRRLKGDVLKDLPDKMEELQYAHMDEKQQQLYDAQVVHMKEKLRGQDEESFKKNKIQILAELTRIRQICCDPALMVENYTGESAKREACMELIDRAIEGEHKMLIFSQFTSMLEILAKELDRKQIEYYVITGATPKEKRLELVKKFNTNSIPVFLISLKAGGTGLNLTGADMVIHYDPWWNVAAQNQATDRAHRIGQTKVVTVYKLIAKGTIEEKIVKMQQDKADLANEILSGENGNITSMTKEDLLELL
nr:SNF2 helicase associated domain-containing protein [uncultured Dorea sp.]